MAEYIEKPLFTISLGQLSNEENIDQRLETIFDYSVKLGGVLLLDEADVVLEARSYENLKRNALVSVFLRMLEYYRGILFLTSNRMKSIDVAFQSRISIGVKFSHMTPDTREEIWLNFINRFDSSNQAARDDLKHRIEEIKDWSLNGRQIRNILRLAESLSFAQEKRRGALRFKHVERIAIETLNFQEIFQEEYRKPRSELAVLSNRKFHEKRAVISHRPSGSSEVHSFGE
ncbi:hypothetical protein Daus18300_002318 [Diaporthe australafricana]|uniref:ATPase AAA-type core domain-containing protein n=1 Tax=Diaporthe australafricana TaxID=127596 RepID=A0ABR3XQG5_9PEZI